MTELEIGTLERVSISQLWQREDRDFTPWLASHLQLLGNELNLRDLELDRTEVNLGRLWGRVDIKAKRSEDEATVVIENQYGVSDDDHFSRLLGYATGSNADILVLVAERISERHRRMIEWLNQRDAMDFYAVEVEGWRIGQNAAPFFRPVAVPERDQSPPTHGDGTEAWHVGTAYADFYRPLADRLRREAGIVPVGKGGWRGRYRSFRTGYEEQGIVYYLALYPTGAGQPGAWAGFQAGGEHRKELYDRLHDCRAEMQNRMGEAGIQFDRFSFGVSQAVHALPELLNDPGSTREWMFENLGKIKEAVQPHLDRIMSELQPGDDWMEGEPPSEIPSADNLGQG